MSRPMHTAGAVLLASLSLLTPAAADVITVQSGSLGYDTGDPPTFFLEGNGLRLVGIFPAINLGPHTGCVTCGPGTAVDLSGIFGGERGDFMIGEATEAIVNGVTYVAPGSGPLRLVGTFEFDTGSVVVPFSSDPIVRLTAPFSFTGFAIGVGFFEIELEGRGRAQLALSSSGQGLYSFAGIDYVFEPSDPIPEPATLGLVAAGLTGLAHLRRRRGQARVRPPEDFGAGGGSGPGQTPEDFAARPLAPEAGSGPGQTPEDFAAVSFATSYLLPRNETAAERLRGRRHL